MPASTSERLALADSRFGSGAPANWYTGLSLVEPLADGTGFTEPPSGVGYARKLVANNTTNWPAAVLLGGLATKRNATKITFADPTGLWGRIAWWIMMTTLSGGTTTAYWGKLDAEITIKAGLTPVEFDINQLVVPF